MRLHICTLVGLLHNRLHETVFRIVQEYLRAPCLNPLLDVLVVVNHNRQYGARWILKKSNDFLNVTSTDPEVFR